MEKVLKAKFGKQHRDKTYSLEIFAGSYKTIDAAKKWTEGEALKLQSSAASKFLASLEKLLTTVDRKIYLNKNIILSFFVTYRSTVFINWPKNGLELLYLSKYKK